MNLFKQLIILFFIFSLSAFAEESSIADLESRALAGDVDAQYSFAKIYALGKGELQDFARSYMWAN